MDSGACKHQRGLHAGIVQILLAQQPVTADGDPLIGGEHQQRVVGQFQLIERLEQSADVMVERRDGSVILVQRAADFRFGARPRREFLVTDGHLAVVEWMHRAVVLH